MSKFTRFIKDIVLPDKVDKERRKKILSEGVIETWTRDEQERKAKEAREIAKKLIREFDQARLMSIKNIEVKDCGQYICTDWL